MLVQSPALTTSVNASPRSFHYAPAPSLRQSPSWVSAALSRRQSTSSAATSVASPTISRAKRYVDAATQYSPMEPFDYAAGAPARSAPTEAQRSEPPPPPGPKPMALPEERPTDPPKTVKAVPETARERKAPPGGDAVQPLSPSKRKNTDEAPSGSSSSSSAQPNAAESPSIMSKRAKPAENPPKLLPQKYELCAVEDVVVLIAHMLGELIETNDALALRSGHLTRFHSR